MNFEISSDPYDLYRSMTPSELEAQARFWQGVMFDKGDPRDLPAGSYNWRFEEAYPLAAIGDEGFDWRAWFEEERAAWAADGDPVRFANMLDGSPIREAVILIEHKGRAWLRDGWHRTGASVSMGREGIPAIVGRLPSRTRDIK